MSQNTQESSKGEDSAAESSEREVDFTIHWSGL